MRHRVWMIAVVGGAVLVLSTCTRATPGLGVYAGDWSGTATFFSADELQAEFTQTGTDVGGRVRFYGGYPYWGYDVGCSVDQLTMTGYFYSDDIYITGNWEVTATLSSDGQTITGTMEIIGNGSTGTFELSRQ